MIMTNIDPGETNESELPLQSKTQTLDVIRFTHCIGKNTKRNSIIYITIFIISVVCNVGLITFLVCSPVIKNKYHIDSEKVGNTINEWSNAVCVVCAAFPLRTETTGSDIGIVVSNDDKRHLCCWKEATSLQHLILLVRLTIIMIMRAACCKNMWNKAHTT